MFNKEPLKQQNFIFFPPELYFQHRTSCSVICQKHILVINVGKCGNVGKESCLSETFLRVSVVALGGFGVLTSVFLIIN